MMNEKNQKALKKIAKVALPFALAQMASLLGIPFGLIFWLFNPIGWKIALSAVIAFPFLTFLAWAMNKQVEKFRDEHKDDE